MTTAISGLIISDKDYYNILSAIGYPAVDENSIYDMITQNQIYDQVIEPSLEDYYKFFPHIIPYNYYSSGANSVSTVNISTTSGNIIGLANMKFVPQSSILGQNSLMDNGQFYANPFFSASNVMSVGGNSFGVGSFGTPFGYGFETNVYQRRFYAKSIESSNKVYYYKFDKYTNTLYYKSNIAGSFYFEFGITDNDFNNIQFDKRQSVLRYIKGNLKLKLAEILGMIELDLPANIDTDKLEEKGKDMVEKEIKYWEEVSSIPGGR